MNLFGPHIHKPGMGLDLLKAWKPRAALAMDVNSDYVRQARQNLPGTVLAVRVYEHGTNFLEWPAEAWVGRLLAKFPADKPDYFVTINEPFGHDSSEFFERFDAWESEVIRLLQAAGTDGLACNFGTGNFTAGSNRIRIPDVFPRICEVANAMGPHDYSWPTLETGWSWYGGRWFKWYDDILAATGREMKFLVGECGLTQAIIEGRDDIGWQSGGPEGVTAESYLATLRWYLEQVVNWDAGRGIVLGLCLFNFYDQFHWSFEHINRPEVVDAIIGMDVPAPPPPEPPNGGDEMEVEIYDMANQKQDKEWMRRLYAVDWERAVVQPGQRVFRLVLLREKEGPHSLVSQVVGEDDQPMENADVAFYWSGAPDPPDPPTEVYPHDWYRNFIHGPTNVNGDVGPGMGTGAYHGAGECGPHQVWVRDPDIPSDRCYCLGMLAGTNHRHMDQRFKLVVHSEEPEPPPPPEPPTDGDLLAEVEKIGADVAAILEWLVGEEPSPPPPEPPADTPFHGEYFNNITLSGTPVLVRDDEKIDFAWGSGSPAPEVNTDDFSVRWTARKTFEARTYTFHALTDDGFRLWVGGQLLLDAWKLQSPTSYQAVKTMTAGQHDIKAEFYERGGGATCKTWWE